jgi:hypothetical protein
MEIKCGECGAQFETQQQLEGHMQRAHETGPDTGSEKGMQSDVEGMHSGGKTTSEP